jgi:hypothetical protein
MATAPQPAAPALVDNPDIAETLADGIAGCSLSNGVLNITLFALRADHSKDPAPNYRQVTGRLALSIQTAFEIRDFLSNALQEYEKRGLFKRQTTKPAVVQ